MLTWVRCEATPHTHEPPAACIASFLAEDGVERSLFIDGPSTGTLWDPVQIKAIAAGVNNELMVRGTRRLRFYGTSANFSRVISEALTNYPYLRSTTQESTSDYRVRPSLAPGTSPESWETVRPRMATRPSIGVNVGQSFTKIVCIGDDGHLKSRRRTPTALCSDRHRPTVIKTHVLESCIELLADRNDWAGVGIAVGGMVREGKIEPRSGITAGMSFADAEIIQDLPNEVYRISRVPVLVTQDVRAKAYYHSASAHNVDTLVLDIGTSLGAAYIDRAGSIPRSYSQLGRVAVDIAADARQRRDGRGVGLLSLYLSAQGAVQTLTDLGIGDLSTVNFEVQLGKIDGRALTRAREDLLGAFAEAMWHIHRYFRPTTVLLTGGMAASRIFATLDQEQYLRDLGCRVTVSSEPTFDAALGVAHAAGST